MQTLTDGRVAEIGQLTGAEADYLLGRWLMQQGERGGARVFLDSGLGSVAERLDALRFLTPESIDVSATAVTDAAAARQGEPAESILRGAYLQRLTELAGPAMSEYLEGFNTFWLVWQHGLPPSLELRVTVDDVAKAQTILNESPALEEVDVRTVSFSATQVAHHMRTTGDVIRANPEIAAAVGSVSTGGTNEVVVVHPLAGRTEARSTVGTALQTDPVLRRLVSDGALRIGESRRPSEPAADVIGGRNAPLASGGEACTWGFNADRNSNGQDVLITAAHCPGGSEAGNLTYLGTVFSHIHGQNNDAIDAQYHDVEGGHTQTSYIAITGQSNRAINLTTTYAAMAINGGVCHQGNASKYTCGYIADKTGGPGYNNYFIRVKGDYFVMLDGDSGGPFFYNNTAYGIARGKDVGTVSTGYFSAIDLVEEDLGLSVRTK